MDCTSVPLVLQKSYGGIPNRHKWKLFKRFLEKVNLGQEKIFTGAHQVIGFRRYCETLEALHTHDGRELKAVAESIVEAAKGRNLEQCVLAVRRIKNVGSFFAWQSKRCFCGAMRLYVFVCQEGILAFFFCVCIHACSFNIFCPIYP